MQDDANLMSGGPEQAPSRLQARFRSPSCQTVPTPVPTSFEPCALQLQQANVLLHGSLGYIDPAGGWEAFSCWRAVPPARHCGLPCRQPQQLPPPRAQRLGRCLPGAAGWMCVARLGGRCCHLSPAPHAATPDVVLLMLLVGLCRCGESTTGRPHCGSFQTPAAAQTAS